MTDPFCTPTLIYVHGPVFGGHWLVTDTELPLLPDTARRAERLHHDPLTGINTAIQVVTDDGATSGWLAPNPERCPLCTGSGHLTVREGSLPRDKHNNPESVPLEELVRAYSENRQPVPTQDEPIDVRRPCPLCRTTDYALSINEEIGELW